MRAWLDRTSMQVGETVTLNVEVAGDTGAAQPDLSALAQDFDLLGTQSSTSVNIVNGQTSSKLLWAVGLSPKHAGELMIPALTVAGQQTSPLTLSVQAASAGGSGGDVYIEATLEPHAPYVQQQMRLSVKLYYALNLLDGNLSEPQGEGLIVRKLGGQDSSYTANVGGRNYHVVERRYALSAEKSGSLTLPAIAFRGHVVDGSNSLDIFFNRGREVSVRSQPIALDVRPRPAASGTDAWLPARSLTLTASGIDAASAPHAGEPLTLTLRMQAQGLGFEQLPELKLPAIDGVDIYPDKPTTQNRDDGEWLYGTRERKFAIVPRQAGELTLPAITLGWWDTAHDRAETVTVPALTLNVQAAANAAVANSTAAPGAENPANLTQPVIAPVATGEAPAADLSASLRWWRVFGLGISLIWVLTVVFAWRQFQRKRRAEIPAAVSNDSAAISSKALIAACEREDFAEASRILLAQAQRLSPRLRNLGELAQALESPEQQAAIDALQRARYGVAQATPNLAAALKTAFRQPIKIKSPALASARSPLPPLYSFRAR